MSRVELHLGDCLDVLRGMEPGSVDAVICDPPYSQNTHLGMRSLQSDGRAASSINFDSWTFGDVKVAIEQCCRVSARWVISFMDYRHAVALESEPIKYGDFLRLGVWVKRNAMRQLTADRPAMGWEAIAFLHNRNAKKYWHGGGRHAVFDHLTVRSGRFEANFHPAEKPVGLVNELIYLFTNPGDTILDPFMGSGTTGVACVQTGRHFIGCEIDPTYYAIAERRIAHAQAQPPLIPHEAAPQPVQNGLYEVGP